MSRAGWRQSPAESPQVRFPGGIPPETRGRSGTSRRVRDTFAGVPHLGHIDAALTPAGLIAAW